ncbi:hypothetical protein [Brucella sp. BO2]|uniref:hypothetical protein n=1 Tax=Brucella sp. BO2 TaxID=693750 RepID=UPI0002D59AF0
MLKGSPLMPRCWGASANHLERLRVGHPFSAHFRCLHPSSGLWGGLRRRIWQLRRERAMLAQISSVTAPPMMRTCARNHISAQACQSGPAARQP